MELLQEIANISGKSGLYRILKPGRMGVIVESLDGHKKKEMISANAKVSVLKEISIYTNVFDKSAPLSDVFKTIKEKHGDQVQVDIKTSTPSDLFTFFEEILPDFNRERVHVSDVKKIIQWYNLLSKNLPESLLEKAPQAE